MLVESMAMDSNNTPMQTVLKSILNSGNYEMESPQAWEFEKSSDEWVCFDDEFDGSVSSKLLKTMPNLEEVEANPPQFVPLETAASKYLVNKVEDDEDESKLEDSLGNNEEARTHKKDNELNYIHRLTMDQKCNAYKSRIQSLTQRNKSLEMKLKQSLKKHDRELRRFFKWIDHIQIILFYVLVCMLMLAGLLIVIVFWFGKIKKTANIPSPLKTTSHTDMLLAWLAKKSQRLWTF